MQLIGVLVLSIVASLAEVVSLGSVIPFLGVLTAPDKIYESPSAKWMIDFLGIMGPGEMLMPLTLMFCAAVLFNGGMRLALLWSTTHLSVMTGADLSFDMYRRTLYQPYSIHISRNSGEVINTISSKSSTVIHIIQLIMNLISSTFILIAILIAMLAVNTSISLIAIGGFSLIYALIIGVTRSSLLSNSKQVAEKTSLVIKNLQEGLGGIRDVLIDGTQEYFCRIYRQADLLARTAQGNSGFLTNSPRFAVETMGLLLIAGLAYNLAEQRSEMNYAVPLLGAMAMGAQRMLPVLQQAYSAWAGIKGNQASLADALALLDQPLSDLPSCVSIEHLKFEREIHIDAVSYKYEAKLPNVLHHIDLVIPKSHRVGFVGPTGSGKSTLIDIVMGLLRPSTGILRVDGKNISDQNCHEWQMRLAHVPQSVFLADATIEENIAFGIPINEINRQRVKSAARQAQIAADIESWRDGYKTNVGERGVRLSGGQRQRIGIARALYKSADVIIFDEATSALDGETEHAVMDAIDSLDPELTTITIAHRISTLKGCDRIYELRDGKVSWSGTYEELIAR